MDNMKIVYVVSFMPSFEGASVGGFDWFVSEFDARANLIAHLSGDQGEPWTHDYTIRSMPVPKHYSNDQITEYLDTEMIEFRELPLPAEWQAIRDLGGAIDLTDKENK
jgi:hypothetical protein